MHVLAYIEADINFPEDVALEVDVLKSRLAGDLDKLIDSIERMISGARTYALIEEGINCMILGYSNVGKSMLFNRLLGRDRSIVYDREATTRDLISERLRLKGMDVVLWDTAGILKDVEEVDAIAIKKTKEALSLAQIVILVLEACRKLNDVELDLLSELSDKDVIVFLNKSDLCGQVDIPMPVKSRGWNWIIGSALEGKGVEDLLELIASYVNRFVGTVDDLFILRKSQIFLLNDLKLLLISAKELLLQNGPAEMIAEEIREAISKIDKLLGRDMDQDLLDMVFSEFCIGK